MSDFESFTFEVGDVITYKDDEEPFCGSESDDVYNIEDTLIGQNENLYQIYMHRKGERQYKLQSKVENKFKTHSIVEPCPACGDNCFIMDDEEVKIDDTVIDTNLYRCTDCHLIFEVPNSELYEDEKLDSEKFKTTFNTKTGELQ